MKRQKRAVWIRNLPPRPFVLAYYVPRETSGPRRPPRDSSGPRPLPLSFHTSTARDQGSYSLSFSSDYCGRSWQAISFQNAIWKNFRGYKIKWARARSNGSHPSTARPTEGKEFPCLGYMASTDFSRSFDRRRKNAYTLKNDLKFR